MLPIDAPYLTARPTLGAWADLAHAWGFEDATAGHDQRGSAYFEIMSAAWPRKYSTRYAYNAGYAEGCEVFYFLTGSNRFAFTFTEDTQL